MRRGFFLAMFVKSLGVKIKKRILICVKQTNKMPVPPAHVGPESILIIK